MLIRYPSDTKGQLYIGTVNTVLWIGCSLVVLYFRSGSRMESAYGLAITVTMLMTTLLLAVYLRSIRKKPLLAGFVLIVFGAIESVFFLSSLAKFAHGGYVAVIMAMLLFAIMVIWYRGTELEQKYTVRLRVRDYLKNFEALRRDETTPICAQNLVYIDKSNDTETLDRDILYSILDRDPKRAEAYWFFSIHLMDEPDVARYHLETFGTDYIFRVRLELGFKNDQLLNAYLRQIVGDLLASGELPPQERKFSIYGPSNVGTFKFGFIKRSVAAGTVLTRFEEFILTAKYRIREMIGSQAHWYGLDTSSLIVESVPLSAPGRQARNTKPQRV